MSNGGKLKIIEETFKTDDSLLLLSVSIGPVQEFVADARKVMDLWKGSRLLSNAVYCAMNPIVNEYGKEVILLPHLPDKPEERTYATLPNVFLAVVKKDALSDITGKIKTNLEDFLLELGKDLKDSISKTAAGRSYHDWENLWDFQFKDHFSLLWVALPVTLSELASNYKNKYAQIQKLMEERKITRTFAPWKGSSAEKCTLCGKREAMGPEGRAENNLFWKKLRDIPPRRYTVKESEKLCAVCLIKRLVEQNKLYSGMDTISFDSTSDITSLPFRKLLASNGADADVKDFIDCCSTLSSTLQCSKINGIDSIPSDWLYKDGLRPESLLKEYPAETDLKPRAINAYNAIAKLEKKFNRSACKYYAVIAMDGDNMGRYLSGEMTRADIFNLNCQVEQSEKLNSLQEDFEKIIKDWDGGAMVYSAGDDLLAFGPLEKALSTMEKLRNAFKKKLETTISAGMVIAHHQDSLRKALDSTRKALETAKDKHGRDAFVITLRLSSGSCHTFGYKWEADGRLMISGLIERVAGWMIEGGSDNKKLGVNLIYDMLSELDAFYRVLNNGSLRFEKEMFDAEVRRLFGRHLDKEASIRNEVAATGGDLAVEEVRGILLEVGHHDSYKSQNTINARDNIEALLKTISFLVRKRVR